MTKNNNITGTQLSYYLICKRKLWLFTRGLGFENYHENVQIGNFIHDTYYKKKKKELKIGPVKIDFISNRYNVIHEVKKSSKLSDVTGWQLKYYLFYLKQYGITARGEINIPEERKKIDVELNEEDEKKLNGFFDDIGKIIKTNKIPEKINSKICKKCSYYEFCYVE